MTAQLAAELAAKESWRLSRWLLVNGIEYLRLNMMKFNMMKYDIFQKFWIPPALIQLVAHGTCKSPLNVTK